MSEKIQEIINKLVEGRQLFESAVGKLDPVVSGQPMSHWIERFKLKIQTEQLSPGTLKDLSMKIMDLHQEATFMAALADAKRQYLHHGNEMAYHSQYMGIYESFESTGKKKPAASTLESMAKVSNENVDIAMMHADIETKFWKNILEHLAMCRRLVENASMNISVELKALSNEGLIDAINRKRNGG